MNEIDIAAFLILFLGIVILPYPVFLLVFQKATEKKYWRSSKSLHKKTLKELRLKKLEEKLKSNIRKRKKSKNLDG